MPPFFRKGKGAKSPHPPGDEAEHYPRVQLQGLSLRVPAPWERTDVPGVDLMVREPVASPPQEQYRPHLQVRTEPSTAPIHELSARKLASLRVDPTPTYIISCDMWDNNSTHPSRRIEFTRRDGAVPVDVVTYLIARPDRAVEVTFTCSVDHRSTFSDLPAFLAASVTFPEDEQ